MSEKRDTTIRVEGMTCASCVRHVGAALREVEGVEHAEVRRRDGVAIVRHAAQSSLDRMIEALREAGYEGAPIPPGQTWVYELDLRHAGTFMYHSHYDEMTQIALGMVGMFIVHPRRPRGPRVDRDYVLMSHEWRLEVGARRPDPNAMSDFNVLTFNGKSFPATEPLMAGTGERIRIRLGNLGPMDHHPIHIHGLNFVTTATDGGYVPESAQYPETTVLVPVGSTRVIEMVPTEPGDWAMHCHMTHHVMTQMGHGIPNMVGADTRRLDRRMARVAPDYMSMGQTGMGGMGEMEMPTPPNSLPMRGGRGPFSYIDMGGCSPC